LENNNFLIVIVGPTAVGKTALSVELARQLDCEILSADSRQFYMEMNIGTAKPTEAEMAGVCHHFVDFLPVEQTMSAGQFEEMAIEKLDEIFQNQHISILTGGSGLYINAVLNGMSEMPSPPNEIRDALMKELETIGLDELLKELKDCDHDYYEKVDKKNHQRVVRALEMIRYTGKPFSSFRMGKKAERNFQTIKIGLEIPRDELHERINKRVDRMIEVGLLSEVKRLFAKRELNALQTVGYKEIFDFLDDKYDWEEAIRLLKRNTRRFAKRQMTWFKKDEETKWFHPTQLNEMHEYIIKNMNQS